MNNNTYLNQFIVENNGIELLENLYNCNNSLLRDILS